MMKIPFLCLVLLAITLVSCGPGNTGEKFDTPQDSVQARLDDLNKKIEASPDNADLLHDRARFYMSKTDFDKALKDIHAAISINDKKSAYFVTLSDIYLFTGRPDNCKESLVKAIGINPKDPDARLKLAKLYLIMKDYPNCFSEVKTLLDMDPLNASAYFTRAIALLEKGDTIRAVTDLKKAVENNQEYYEAYVQLGELYAVKKDGLAELYLKNALNIRPQSREALYMLGLFYQETGHYEQAISVYLNQLKIDSAFREAPYNIGYINLVYEKDYNKAIQYFSEALKRDPGYFKALYNRGYAYELSGQYAKAREDYQKTLKIEVNYEKAVEGLNRLDRMRAN
jgi:tetratricopeptide (TPR) repeat protein